MTEVVVHENRVTADDLQFKLAPLSGNAMCLFCGLIVSFFKYILVVKCHFVVYKVSKSLVQK